jgi:DNA-binding transcriptional regulator YiaG
MINNRGFYSVTQVKFADLLGIKLVTYQKWEQGVRNPSGPSASCSMLPTAGQQQIRHQVILLRP